MTQTFKAQNDLTADGVPDGGMVVLYTQGAPVRDQPALWIRWQRGPLGRGADRKEPNGCFVETVLEAAAQRLEFYQAGRFASAKNEEALLAVRAAIEALQERTLEREERGVEGLAVE